MEMEVVLGGGEDAIPKSRSLDIESAKEHNRSAETALKDDDGQMDGVRVFENGEKKSNDDEKKNENVVEKDNLNESGLIEDCVMNGGASSLLKLKQDVKEEEICEDEDYDEDCEDDEEETHGYYVGDFVWGKIKNHQWWPGQIYDPSDASDLALKVKQKGKLLVTYFGNGKFAWCSVSQMKPFAESFKEFSKMSNSRSFLGAVEEAVEEMGRHIERLLICDCAAEEKHKFDSPEANNVGIKVGVFVPYVRREVISSLLVGKYGEILRDVKYFAETVSFSNLLELEILKRKLSAFYRSKREYGLTEYHEPRSVPGLEDKNNDDGGLELHAKRSSVDEAAFDPKEWYSGRSLEKCYEFPDNRLHHRRKQKSIADILENESAAKVRFETEGEDGDVKSNGRSGKKITKRRDEVNGELDNVTTTTRKSEVSTVEEAKQVEENCKVTTVSRKRKKKDVDGDDDDDGSRDREEAEKNEVSEPEIDIDSTPLASSVEKNAENGEITTQTSKRERKKSKYLSPEYVLDFSWNCRKKSKTESEISKVSRQSLEGEQMTNASESLVAVEEDKLEELRNAADFLRLGATSDEMGDLIRLSALGTQYPIESSSRYMVREYMSIYRSFTYHKGANHKFVESYDMSDKGKEVLNEMSKSKTQGKDIKDKKLKGKQQAENGTGKQGTTKKERKHKRSESKKQADQGEETWKDLCESTGKERKRKKHEPKKQAEVDEVEETQNEASESTKKERKPKKPKYEEGETQYETVEPKNKKKRKKKFSGVKLFVTFGAGSSLPKKEDLIEIYEQFGALDKERTYMNNSDFRACVSFLDVADGEKAFESSKEEPPFASASTVKFRLKYPKVKTVGEVGEMGMKMEYAKKKLEEMRMLLDECKGEMSEEVNVKLEAELVNLLEKVRVESCS